MGQWCRQWCGSWKPAIGLHWHASSSKPCVVAPNESGICIAQCAVSGISHCHCQPAVLSRPAITAATHPASCPRQTAARHHFYRQLYRRTTRTRSLAPQLAAWGHRQPRPAACGPGASAVMHPPLLPDLHPICKDVSVVGFAPDPHRRSCTPGLVCMAPRFSAAVCRGRWAAAGHHRPDPVPQGQQVRQVLGRLQRRRLRADALPDRGEEDPQVRVLPARWKGDSTGALGGL